MKSSEPQPSRPRLRDFRRLVLLLAPVALLLAAWLLPDVDANGRLGIKMGRDEALTVARGLALEMGRAELAGPDAVAVVRRAEESSDLRGRYLRRFGQEAPEDAAVVERLVPPLVIQVKLSTQDGEQLEVMVSPAGEILGFEHRRAPRDLSQAAENPSVLTALSVPSDPETLARASLRDRLGEELFRRLRLMEPSDAAVARSEDEAAQEAAADDASDEPGESGGNSDSAERDEDEDDEADSERDSGKVEWTRTLEGLPGLELEFEVQVRDGEVMRQTVSAEITDGAVEDSLKRSEGGMLLLVLAWMTVGSLAVFAFAYGLWRYVDRLQESEVSHGRTALLGAGVGLVACLVLYSVAITNFGGLEELGWNFSLPIFLAVVFTFFFIAGLFLGVVWAGCEGDVREVYADRLISLDALFGGRLFSRNLASAVVAAMAVAAWLMLARVVALLPWADMPQTGPSLATFTFTMLHPWQFAFSKAFGFLILFAPLAFLVPLSVIRRWTRSRRRTLPVLALLSFLAFWVNPAAALGTLPSLAGMAEAAVWAVAFLAAFLLFDVLTALLSYAAAVAFLQLLYFVHQPAPSLMLEAGIGASALLVVLLLALAILRFGSDLTAEEVRPGYARNMLERVALSAELSAARQAQGRMLPQEPPQVAGATLTSCCPPEWESEGEYFDFFPLEEGRMGLAVADFGRAGLAAALRMTLAKGFLLSYSWQDLGPEEIVERLLRRLGELVTEEGDIALAFAGFDPEHCRLTLARGPRSPLVALLPAAGGEPRLLAGAESEEAAAEGAVPPVRTVDLSPGDRLVFAMVEGVDWGAPKDRDRDRWLDVLRRTRARSAEELLKMIRNRGLTVGTILVLAAEEPVPRRRAVEGGEGQASAGGEAAA